MNIYHFSCQYLNNPIPSEAQYFNQGDFQYVGEYDAVDSKFQGLQFYIGVDPAGGVDTVQRGDDTAIVVIGVRGSRSQQQVYVVDVVGGQMRPSEINSQLALLNDKWRPRRIGVETSGVGKMFWAQLQDWCRGELLYLPLLELKRGGTRESKSDRIGALEPRYRSRSVFHLDHLKGGKLEEQLLRFKPGGAVHDDYPDALAMAVESIQEGLQGQTKQLQFGRQRKPLYRSTGY